MNNPREESSRARSKSRSYLQAARTIALLFALFSLLTSAANSNSSPLLLHHAFAAAPGSIDLSNSAGVADYPKIATSGNNVYAAWYLTPASGIVEIHFANSSNLGKTFSPAITLTNSSSQVNTGNYGYPLTIAAARAPNGGGISNNVYVAWSDWFASGQVFYTRSTDGGKTFSKIINLSNDTGTAHLPSLVAPDDGSGDVYAVWADTTLTPSGNFQIFFAKSTNGGATFSKPIALSNGTAESADYAEVAVSGSNVYVIWVDQISGGNINGRSSTNGGASFGNEVTISSAFLGSLQSIVANGSTAYVVWNGAALSASPLSEIYISNTTDAGATYSTPYDLSNDKGITVATNTPQIAISPSDGEVYVVWPDASGAVGNTQIFENTISSGKPGKSINLSNSTGTAADPAITISSSGIAYASWTDNYAGSNQIYSTQIASSKFNGPAEVSSSAGQTSHSQIAAVHASGNDSIYISWSDTSGGGAGGQDVMFASNPNYVVPEILVGQVSSYAPAWGTPVTISGRSINYGPQESVAVNWGDGSPPTTGIPLNPASGLWGPATHTYNSSAMSTNPNQVVVHLVNSTSGSVLAQNGATDLILQKHTSAVSMNFIESVLPGYNIVAKGNLIDLNASGAAIPGKTITFGGDGSAHLAGPVVTAVNGSFSSTGASPNQPGDGWTVMGIYAGDATYTESNNTATYDTAPLSAKSISVPAGNNVHVNLNTTGFTSSMTFDQVTTAGVIYTWSCGVIQNTTNYTTIHNLCVGAAPGLAMAPNSFAHVQISYSGASIPAPYKDSNVDLFMIDSSPSNKVIDITESRDTTAKTVTGSVSSFSSFVVAVALHASFPPVCTTSQVYAGSDPALNTVNFGSFTPPTASLDKVSYKPGSVATLTVTDPNAVVNPAAYDNVAATVTSTSGPASLALELNETSPGSGIFTAQFETTSGATSNTTKVLHVQPGDHVSAQYGAYARAPIRLLYTGVTGSGIIGVCDYVIDPKSNYNTQSFITIGSALNATSDGVQLSTTGSVGVTMYYGSDNIGTGNPGTSVGIFQYKPGLGWVDITLPGSAGHDLNSKLVYGKTSVPGGLYTLGFCPTGCPGPLMGGGGGGGGIGLAGSGIVVDFVASIVSDSPSGGNGGGTIAGASGGGTGGPGTDLTTYPADYFVPNPLAKVKIYPLQLNTGSSSGQPATSSGQTTDLHTGQQVTISSEFKNYEQTAQPYAFITLITDSNGFTETLNWQTGSLDAGGGQNLSNSWTPDSTGTYTIRTFVWDSVSGNPVPLSEAQEMTVSVSG